MQKQAEFRALLSESHVSDEPAAVPEVVLRGNGLSERTPLTFVQLVVQQYVLAAVLSSMEHYKARHKVHRTRACT